MGIELQDNPLLTLALLVFFLMGVVILVQQFLIEQTPLEERIARIKRNKDMGPGDRAAGDNLWESFKKLSRKVNPVAVLGQREVEKARAPLVTAGYRSEDALTVFVLIKLITATSLAAVVLLIIIFTQQSFNTMSYVFIFSGAIGGSILVNIVAENMAKSRQERIRKVLPDVVDIILICIRSGMTFEGALQRLLVEPHDYMREINDELQLTLTEMQILREREMALKRLADRLDIDEVRVLASSVIQAEKYGTSLSETFGVMSEEMRNLRVLRAEAWAARAPVMLTIPMVLFLLPLLFIVVLGPGVIRILEVFN